MPTPYLACRVDWNTLILSHIIDSPLTPPKQAGARALAHTSQTSEYLIMWHVFVNKETGLVRKQQTRWFYTTMQGRESRGLLKEMAKRRLGGVRLDKLGSVDGHFVLKNGESIRLEEV